MLQNDPFAEFADAPPRAPAPSAPRPLINGPPRQAPLHTQQTPDEAAIDAFRVQQAPLEARGQTLINQGRESELGRIPEAAAQNLLQDVDSFAALNRAVGRFQDDYSGWGSGIENRAQGAGVDFGLATSGQRDYWSDFQAADAAARNRLFGASLTPGEQASFAQTTVSPNMAPDQVRQNMWRRMEMARSALRRRVNFLRESGYDNAAIDALLGEYGAELGEQPNASPGQAPPAQPGSTLTGYDRSQLIINLGTRPSNEGGAFVTTADREAAEAVRQMIHSGRSAGEVAAFMQARGLPANMDELNAATDARRRNRPWRVEPAESGSNEPSFLGGLHQGAVQSGPGAMAGAYVDTMTGGHLDNLSGIFGADSERVNFDMGQLRERHPGWSLAGDIGAGASLYGTGRMAAGAALGRGLPAAAGTLSPAAIGSDAAMGAYIGSGQEGTDPFSVSGTTTGAMAGAGGGLVGRGAINTIGRAVSPTGGALAPLYREGVQPTLGQRAGGAVDRFEQATTSVPFLGGLPRRGRNNAIEQFQAGAFNQSLREIGQELPRGIRTGTAAHRYMQEAFNREFRDIRGQMRFTPDGQFTQEFGALQQGLSEISPQSRQIFETMVRNQISNQIRRTGSLSGQAYIRAASRFDARARAIRRQANGDPDLAEALESFSTMLDEAAARQGPPELSTRLQAARSGYRRAVVIEDAARRRGSGQGEFSPAQLDAAVQNVGGGLRSRAYLRGDAPMQDYAQAGLRLGDTLPNSGSADRILASGAIGSAGYASPWLLAPLGVSIGANAPGFRQALNAALRPRPALEGTRRRIQGFAPGASLLGPGLIPMLPRE